LLLITVIALIVRWVGLGHPGSIVFDEHYAQDACLYAFGAGSVCPNAVEVGSVHPPLAKWLIAAPIRVFGYQPVAWRLAPLAAGTLSVAALYLLTRRLSRSTIAASLAAGLLAFDFLHYVLSRTAMLDIFVLLFGTLSVLFIVYDSDRAAGGGLTADTSLARRIGRRRWLVAAGIAGGAAVASKWSGAYVYGAAVLLAVAHAVARHRARGSQPSATAEDGVLLLGCLVVLPLVVYAASYTERLHASVLAWPWTRDSWVHAFVEQHHTMLEHHTGPLYVHPYTSPAWSWPLIKRPVLFHFRPTSTGYQEILAIGSPVAWWTALLAMAATAWHAVRARRLQTASSVAIIGFAAAYLPWFVITRREAFLYYFLPATPFMYLAVADVVARMKSRSIALIASIVLMLGTIGMFTFFWPVLAGRPLAYEQWERRMLFHDCGPAQPQGRKRPVNRVEPPPRGWCWV
jgi:dolichyl-phosphate-mannose--protein O-mannosyl transferase